jgi:UDP-glucose 4-epimerase
MNGKVLVTGGTGYIGSHTVVELINSGYDVEIVDNLFNSKIEVLDRIEKITGVKPVFHQVDILDYEALHRVFDESKFDVVIHFAALKAVGESVEKPLNYYENNIGGTVNLLKCMQDAGVEKIIFSSSATVYGEQETPECVETMQTGLKLTNPYGRTKYFIEEILKDLCVANPNMEVALLRYFNPIGAHPTGLLGEDPNGIPNNLMPIIMQVARGQREKLSVYGDDYPTEDGTCRRDYIHVVDLAKGHIATINHLKKGVSIYNLGTGRPSSVKEMIAAFEQASGKELPYEIVGRRAGDLAELWANADKAKAELGWQTELTIDDAMRDTLNFLKNEAAIE